MTQHNETHASMPHSPSATIAVIGAGPKAAALAVKAQVLRNLGFGDVEVIVIEKNQELAANWFGHAGFTDGQCLLGTPPEKDVGFPYESVFGSDVDFAMQRYSWQGYFIVENAYSDWVDRGKPQPRHEVWAKYIRWALGSVSTQIVEGRAVSIEKGENKLLITVERPNSKEPPVKADGVVFTGPGEPLPILGQPQSEKILDGRNYWQRMGVVRDLGKGRIAIIGGGETAASIAVSIIDKMPELNVDIINRHGAIFTRGESFGENRVFSKPNLWVTMDPAHRAEFIQHTDRGVFSVDAQRKLALSDNVSQVSGIVSSLRDVGSKVIVNMNRAGIDTSPEYDLVIVASGFDPWLPAIEMFPEDLRPTLSQDELSHEIDFHLRLPFGSAPRLKNFGINVHMPMLSGISQGPGFPNLSCLGHLSDRILSLYVSHDKCRQEKDGTWSWERLSRKNTSIVKRSGFATEADAKQNAIAGWQWEG